MPELFDHFEINRSARWPRLGRALAGSLVLHACLVAVVAYVPTLRSMLHIAGLFASADYVEEDYELADVRQRAVMLKLAPQEKLYYPAGYFSTVESPLAPPMPDAQVIEQANAFPVPPPPRRRPSVRPTPQPTPTPAATPDTSATPEVADATGTDTTGEAAASATPTEAVAPKTEEELQKLAEKTKTKRFPKINIKPFQDLIAKSKLMLDNKELDLSGTISMTVEADRNEDGTLANIVITKVSTDNDKLKTLATEFVQALSASRALVALEGTRHLTMTVDSNPTSVSALVTTKTDTPERASEMALGYGSMIAFGRLTKSGQDEAEIYKNTKVSAVGSELRLSFAMPRPAVTKMLTKRLPTPPTT